MSILKEIFKNTRNPKIILPSHFFIHIGSAFGKSSPIQLCHNSKKCHFEELDDEKSCDKPDD